MIKPPFTAKSGLSGIWIEGADGVTVADINPLIDPEIAFDLATLLARGANEVLRQREHVKRMAASPNVGRPRSKKPSPLALAKRKSRAKQKSD